VILRHDDVKRLFSDTEIATPDRSYWELHQPAPEGSYMRWAEEHSLFTLPPAEHARVRRLFSVALTPRAVKRYDQQVRETVERFAAPLRVASGLIELTSSFSDPIPNAVISRITGIPPAGDDERRFAQLAQTAIRGIIPLADEETKQAADEAFLELAKWVRALSQDRRATLEEDMISDLIRAQDRDDRLTDDEIVMTITGLIAAGSETTAMGGMVAAKTLLAHPDQMERLRREPRRIPNAVSEILRTGFGFGGIGGPARYAKRDFELRGKTIRKGEMMLLSFDGAGRDPAVYDDPDRFDVTREVSDLMTFGHGVHYCLGAHLARQEIGVMIEALLDILPPGSRCREDLVEYKAIGPFRRPLTLPIEIGPR
jgi:cytochrome P450